MIASALARQAQALTAQLVSSDHSGIGKNGFPRKSAETRSAPVADVADRQGDDGSAVLDDVEAFLRRFVAYPSEHARVAHTLWIAHTHAIEAFDSTPRLAFLSPEPASGKTRGLEVSELLVPRPVEFVNVSAAYIFRKVDDPDGTPTILFDEIDTVFGPKAREHEDVRGLLNAGHRKGAVAGRCVVRGKAIETVEYPAYCAVAMAGLGDLPDTILSRSVVIRMRRRARGEHVEAFRRRLTLPTGHALRDRLAHWAAVHIDQFRDAWPEMPANVEDRDADVWEALLAVADAAGGTWPQRARAAAVALVAQSKETTPSLGIRLLADLRMVFGEEDTMTTDAALSALHDLPEAPWAELIAGKPLNARGLAKRLGEYGIKSKPVRVGDKVVRGYAREDLADPWERYLPSPGVADKQDHVADSEGGAETAASSASRSPRESATSATSATPSSEPSSNSRVYPHGNDVFDQPQVTTESLFPAPLRLMRSATLPSKLRRNGEDVTDVAHVADFRGDQESHPEMDHEAVILETAKRLATCSADELAAYRKELACAPVDDPHIHIDRQALALFEATRAAGARL